MFHRKAFEQRMYPEAMCQAALVSRGAGAACIAHSRPKNEGILEGNQ
jgi:hypothetical protein